MNHWLRAGSVQVYLDSGEVWIVHGKRPRSWLLSCATARPACKLQPTGTSKPSSCNNLTCNLQPATCTTCSCKCEREGERVRESARVRAYLQPRPKREAQILPGVTSSVHAHSCSHPSLSSCLLASCPVALSPHTKLSQSTLLIRPPAAAAGAAGAQPSPAQTRVHTFL